MTTRAFIIDESRTVTLEDFERLKPEFDKIRKMFKVSEREATLPDGRVVRIVTWVSHQQPTITLMYHQ